MEKVTHKAIGLGVLLLLMLPSPVFAQYSSSHYQINESFFGAGGELEDTSPHYMAKTAAGELGVDRSASTNFQAYAGFNTTDTPLLEVVVSGGIFDMGYLDENNPKAITTFFTVRNYLSSGYTVSLSGTPPVNRDGNNHMLTALTTPTASNPGQEQFGVNLVANNISPIGPFGAAPQQLPDSTFGFGQPTADYNTANLFKFVDNDVIANSPKSSGVTSFTLSTMANITKHTLAGYYGTALYVNVVPTF
jgi:hypothetical protein